MSENTNLPLVSVLVFAFNHESYIKQTIESVVNQKCSFKYEIIICDDFSTDDTLKIVRQKQLENPSLIRVLANDENLGLNKTFLNAVIESDGDFISILGGDDYWIINNKLEIQINLLLNNKEISYVHTEYKAFKEVSNEIISHMNTNWNSDLMKINGEESLTSMLCNKWKSYPLSSSSCFRKSPLVKGIKNHPETLEFDLAGEGSIIHASMCFYGGGYAFIPIETTMYRIRENSLSHYEDNSEVFLFNKKYFMLRLLIAKSFRLNMRNQKKIQNIGMYSLLENSLNIGTLSEFRIFIRTHDFGLIINAVAYLVEFKVFGYLYKVLNKIKRHTYLLMT